jgi:hypothetical protein
MIQSAQAMKNSLKHFLIFNQIIRFFILIIERVGAAA